MPLAPTTYMQLIRPTPGADDDVWDDLVNTLLELVDAHDHSTNKGTKVTSAGINIDATLEANNNRITEVAGLAMQNLGADLTSGSYELYVTGGNLKFRNGTGTNVRITNGAALDITAASGIGGDYAGVGAEVAYVDATDAYTFKQQVGAAVRQYAKLQSADLNLFEYIAHPAAGPPANSVRLRSPAALGASYDVTFAGAVPGSTSIVQVSAAGQLSYSNTIANAVTLSSTLAAVGLITAQAGVTASAGQHFTVSGAGEYKHGDRVLNLPAALATNLSAASYNNASNYVDSSGLGQLTVAIPLLQGDRITTITYTRSGDGVVDISGAQVTHVTSAGANTNLGSTTETNVAAIADTTINVADTTLAAGDVLIFQLAWNGANLRFYNLRVTYNRP